MYFVRIFSKFHNIRRDNFSWFYLQQKLFDDPVEAENAS